MKLVVAIIPYSQLTKSYKASERMSPRHCVQLKITEPIQVTAQRFPDSICQLWFFTEMLGNRYVNPSVCITPQLAARCSSPSQQFSMSCKVMIAACFHASSKYTYRLVTV